MRTIIPPPRIHHKPKLRTPLGFKEGVSKALSNMLAYGVDSRKTLYQYHGHIPALSKSVLVTRWTSGITSASFCVGLIYYLYYTIYNRFLDTPYAGPLAAFAISMIKLPIYNSMKVMQSARVNTLYSGLKYLSNTNSVYTGYGVSLVEDMVELDIKNRLYNTYKKENTIYNICIGTCASAFAAAFTTPFDNIRLQMCMHKNAKPLGVIKQLIASKNLYKGIRLRTVSNATKNISFFIIFELLKHVLN